MTVEQTQWFHMEVDHLYNFAQEWQYTTGFADMAQELLCRLAKFRHLDNATMHKLCAKVNQKLHRKVYAYT